MVGLGAARASARRDVEAQPAAGAAQPARPADRGSPGSPAGFDDIARELGRRPTRCCAGSRWPQRIASRAGGGRCARARAATFCPVATRRRDAQAIARAESPAAGPRAAARRARIPEEMTMLDSPVLPRPAPPRSPRSSLPQWRSRRPPPTAASSSSSSAAPPTGWHTVAPTGDPAFAGLRGALRRAIRQRREARQHLHAPSGAGRDRRSCMQPGRRCSSMPSPRPIATARISTGRTCSRPAGTARLPAARTAG